MSRLEIHIRGVTRERLESRRDQSRQASPLGGTRAGQWLRDKPAGPSILRLSPFGLAIASVAVVGGVLYISTPVALIGDVPVRGRHVLFLADDPLQNAANARIDLLTRAGMSVERAGARNVARRSTGGFVGALNQIDDLIAASDAPSRVSQELAQHPDVDAVYVMSNFSGSDDRDRPAQLQALIRKNGVRLYLDTADKQPSPELLALAKESGGGVLQSARK